MARIKKGDQVITNGGLIGRVAAVRDDEVDVEVAPRPDRAARLTLRSGAKAVRLVLRPLAHAGTSRTVDLPAHGSTELTWPTDHGWFDVEVTCAQDAAFRRRVTGHVDTGRESLTP